MQKSGMQELLESVGYVFFMDPSEDGSINNMGFLTPHPVLRYSPPPQMGISLDDVQVDIVRTAWQDYQTRKDWYGKRGEPEHKGIMETLEAYNKSKK